MTAGNEWQGKGNCAECRRREYCKKECTARKKLVQHFSGVTMKRLMQEQGYFTTELLSSANVAINTGMSYGKDDAAPEEIVKLICIGKNDFGGGGGGALDDGSDVSSGGNDAGRRVGAGGAGARAG